MADPHGRLSERMAALARDLQEHHADPLATMELSTSLAVTNIDAADAAGLTIVERGRQIRTEAATDDLVVVADRLQYELEEGPCLDAIWQERTISSPSLAYDHRWPRWGPRVAEETGAQSVLAFQLFTHGVTLGALNLYSRTKDAFDAAAQDEGLAIAAHVAVAVSAAREVNQMHVALDSRTAIAQAVGILMERFSLDPAGAFEVLGRLSSHSNTKLRDVAAELVRTRELPDTRR